MIADPQFAYIDLVDFAELAYSFMIGLPGWASSGFCMMDPETLKKQRYTFVKYWHNKLNSDRAKILNQLGS